MKFNFALRLLGFIALFPSALRRLGDEAFFERARGDADVADFAAGQQRLHALQVHMELALGDGGDVRADAAGFLGFTLRQMMLPFIGRLPVNSQMRDIKFFS